MNERVWKGKIGEGTNESGKKKKKGGAVGEIRKT